MARSHERACWSASTDRMAVSIALGSKQQAGGPVSDRDGQGLSGEEAPSNDLQDVKCQMSISYAAAASAPVRSTTRQDIEGWQVALPATSLD